jgi:nucleoside phosphorylase
MNETIGITMATFTEAVPFIRNLNLTPIEEKPFPVYSWDQQYLIVSGIGKTKSAIATSYLINKYKIKNMINLGAAGATGENHNIGDILQIGKCIDYNYRTDREYDKSVYTPDVINGIKCTSLSTHDVPVIAGEERELISKYSDLVDMEGAPFINSCRVFSSRAFRSRGGYWRRLMPSA